MSLFTTERDLQSKLVAIKGDSKEWGGDKLGAWD